MLFYFWKVIIKTKKNLSLKNNMAQNNKKIWLSHSGIEILERCPRCFWLKYNKKISQPEGITSRLPDRFDRIIKKYFDRFRPLGELPPLVKGRVEGQLENPFKETYFYEINEKYGFYGKLDECLIWENKYIPVDFKTSSSDPRGRNTFAAYQNQMDEYAFLLEQNGKRTAGFGYLIYFYPEHGDHLHNGFPMVVHIEKVATNPHLVRPRLLKAVEILEQEMPKAHKDCPFCSWYDALSQLLK